MMTTTDVHAQDATRGRGGGAGSGRQGIDLAARFGFAAHGTVYGLIAIFALDAAFGGGGEQAKGSRAAVSSIAQSDWGTVLLIVLAAGLVAYGLMRLWQGFADPAGHGTDAKGVGVRIGRAASGFVQLALAFYVLSLAFGWFSGSASGGGGGVESLTARVMSWPAGRWIIGGVGVAIVLASLRQLHHAISADFMDELAARARSKNWIKPTGRVGFTARFVVFGIVGVLITIAAVQANPDRAEGLGGALRTLQDQAYGPWLLGIVAAGLLAFAVTRGIYARYKVVPHHD